MEILTFPSLHALRVCRIVARRLDADSAERRSGSFSGFWGSRLHSKEADSSKKPSALTAWAQLSALASEVGVCQGLAKGQEKMGQLLSSTAVSA